MNQTGIAAFFPTLLLRARIAEHEKIAAALVPEAHRLRATVPSGPHAAWACPLYTTYLTAHDLHRRDAFRTIVAVFLEEALAFAERKSVDLRAQPIDIDRCWLNVFARGDSMDVHNHPNSLYTGYYFIEAPEDGTRLILYHPAKEMGFSMPVVRESLLNQEGFTCVPRAGDLVLFESHIVHSFHLHDSPREHLNLGFTVCPDR